MSEHDHLKNIVFISLPDTKNIAIDDFTLDPAVLLPVEIPEGEQAFQLDSLSWEMITAAILKLFAYRPDHPNIDYYRDFILAVQPDLIQDLLQIGVFKAQQQEYDLAAEMFLALTNLVPAEEAPYVNLALVYEQKNLLYTNLGNHSIAENYCDSAAEIYKKGLTIHPESLTLLHNGGVFFLKQENREKAEELFLRFLRYAPGDDPRRKNIAAVIEKSTEQNKNDTLFAEAFDHIKMGKEKQGIEKITLYLQQNPDIWNAWFLLGWAYRKIGEYKKGKAAFEKSIALDDTQPDVYNELAGCLMELELYAEAKNCFEQGLKLEPENTKIISNLGILALKTGNFKEALGFFRTVLETDPHDTIAQKYIEFIEKNP